MHIKSAVIHSIKWMTFARLAAQLLRWSATLIIIRILTPADFSIVALAETVLGFLEMFAVLGLAAAIIRTQDPSNEFIRAIFTLIAIVNGGLAMVLFSSASLAADFYRQPELVMVMRVLSIGFLLTIFESIPSALLAKAMRFKEIAIIQLVSGVAGAAVSLVMAHLGFGYWTLVAGGLAMQLTRTLATLIVQPLIPLPTLKLSKAWEAATFGSFVLGSSLLYYLYVTLDVIIAGRFWDAETLGVYAVALQLATMPLSKIMPTMKQVALPAYSKAQTDRAASRYYLLKSLRLSMGVGFPVFFGLASVAALLVPLLFNTKWADASTPVTLLFLAMPFRMFLELHEPAVIAAGSPQSIFRNSLIVVGMMAPAFFAASFFDPNALAAVWVTIFPLLALFSSYRYCRFLGVDFLAMLKQVGPAFLISAAMFVCVRLFIHHAQLLISSWVTLIISILLGVAVFVAGTAVVDRSMFSEYRSLLKSKKSPAESG